MDLLANRRRLPTGAIVAPEQFDLAEAGARRDPPPEPPGDGLGDLAKFLCSDAAAHLNGVALPVEGG